MRPYRSTEVLLAPSVASRVIRASEELALVDFDPIVARFGEAPRSLPLSRD